MRGLYAIIDPEHCLGRDPVWVAERVLEGGCAALQLRAKQLGWERLVPLARALRERCHAAGVPFWLNDYLEVAIAVGADGLHLGFHCDDFSRRQPAQFSRSIQFCALPVVLEFAAL